MADFDIFLSYSRKDEVFAGSLLKDLERFNVQGFMDESDVSYVSNWTRKTTRAIESSDAFLVVLSESAKQSNFVMAELGQAISFGKPIIPVLSPGSDIEDSIPEFLMDRIVLQPDKMSSLETTAFILAVLKGTSPADEMHKLRIERRRRKRNAVMILIAAAAIFIGLILSLIFRGT